jgi:hypothetical protein
MAKKATECKLESAGRDLFVVRNGVKIASAVSPARRKPGNGFR